MLQVHFADCTSIALLEYDFQCRTFTCNRVFLQCGSSIFTEVEDLNTSSTTDSNSLLMVPSNSCS